MQDLAKLKKENINIFYVKQCERVALFFSSFFETCGIFTTLYDINYLVDKNKVFESKSICILNNITEEMKENFKDSIFYVQLENQNIDATQIKKFVSYLGEKWNISLDEMDELQKLLDIFIKNDLWFVFWTLEESCNREKIINEYISNLIKNAKEDLEYYLYDSYPKDLYSSYMKHMQFYLNYMEQKNWIVNDIKKCEVISKYEDEKFGSIPGKLYPSLCLLWGKTGEMAYYHITCLPCYRSVCKEIQNSYIYNKLAEYWDYQSSSIPKVEVYEKAYQLDLSNYVALYNISSKHYKLLSENFSWENLKNAIIHYRKVENILAGISSEDYTTFLQIEYLLKTLIKQVRIETAEFSSEHDYYKQLLKEKVNYIMNGNLYEHLFADMSFGKTRNMEIENIITERSKYLVKKNVNI